MALPGEMSEVRAFEAAPGPVGEEGLRKAGNADAVACLRVQLRSVVAMLYHPSPL